MYNITTSTIRQYFVDYYGTDLLVGVSDTDLAILMKQAGFLLDSIYKYSRHLQDILSDDTKGQYLNNAIAEECYYLQESGIFTKAYTPGTDLSELEALRDIGIREAHLDVIGVTFQSTYRYNNKLLTYLYDKADYWMRLLGFSVGNQITSFDSSIRQYKDNMYSEAGGQT